jgi:NADH:ubiquinone oxidoreductase subunit 3 (subunit A)
MNGIWSAYSVVFVSAATALMAPLFLSALARAFSYRYRVSLKRPGIPGDLISTREMESREQIRGQRLNTRYFLAMNIAVVLSGALFIIIPVAAAYRDINEPVFRARAAAVLLSTLGLVAVSAVYASKKGDLEWLTTFRGEKQ